MREPAGAPGAANAKLPAGVARTPDSRFPPQVEPAWRARFLPQTCLETRLTPGWTSGARGIKWQVQADLLP